jgi:bacteriocin biosynthesis cyclodehydratase domain-containing protein
VRSEVQRFIYRLDSAGFLNHQIATLAPPIRSNGANGAKSKELDLALNQLRARSTPELMQSEWIDGCADGGTSTVAARSQYVIELIGRSRTITLLYSLLLASGVSRIRFADRHLRPRVGDLDIGCGAIVASDLGGNYYEILESRRRELSLFPIERNQAIEPNLPPHLVIHAGEIDPELATQWSNQRQPYLLIHPAIGDEVLIGPLVKPGVSPCVRCLSLYERDNFAFTRTERIPLTAISDLPMITAHYVAAIAAAQALHFIDSATSEVALSHRNTGVGELTYINLQRLSEPQVVAIARHPLCGCDR